MRKLFSNKTPVYLAAVVLFLAVSPLFFSIGKITGNTDFLQLATRHYLLKKAVLEQGQFPLWTPYLNGGFPSIADPEDPALSPFSLLTIAFGEAAGLQLIALLIFFAGCASMYRMSRVVYGVSAPGAALGAAIYGLGGWFVTRIYSGNINELYYFLTPAIVLTLERLWATGAKKWLLIAAGALFVIAMDGKTTFITILLFMAVYSVVRAVALDEKKLSFKKSLPWWFFAAAALSLFFSAVKIVPALHLFSLKGSLLHPVIDTHTGVYKDVLVFGWGDFARGLLFPGTLNRAVSLYVGALPLFLALVGVFRCFKKVFPWCVTAVVFSFLWAGPNSPVDLLHLLWRLPFFGAISQPHKYFDFFVVLSVCAAASVGFDALVSGFMKRERLSFAVGVVAAALAVVPLFAFSFPKYQGLYYASAPELRSGDFFEVKLSSDAGNGLHMYLNAKQNIGTLNWYGGILLPTAAAPKYFVEPGKGVSLNPRYSGESYCLKKDNNCAISYFSANTAAATVEVSSADRLVFNLNYDTAWRSDYAKAEDYGGLLSLKVRPAAERQVIVVDYRPDWFYVGAAISLFSFLAALVWCFPSIFRIRAAIKPS